jgi:hypothetical protein
MPTRVISVGLQVTDAPRLLISRGKVGRYVALSYCVGMPFLFHYFEAPRLEHPMTSNVPYIFGARPMTCLYLSSSSIIVY